MVEVVGGVHCGDEPVVERPKYLREMEEVVGSIHVNDLRKSHRIKEIGRVLSSLELDKKTWSVVLRCVSAKMKRGQ